MIADVGMRGGDPSGTGCRMPAFVLATVERAAAANCTLLCIPVAFLPIQ